MSFNKLLLFRQFFAKQTFLKSIKLKNISTETKSDKKIQEIKDFVINQKQLESNPLKEVKKAVVLYGNENSNYFRKIFAFNCLQFLFWLYLSNSGLALILKKPKSEADRQRLESDKSLSNQLSYLWTHSRNQLLVSIAMYFLCLSI